LVWSEYYHHRRHRETTTKSYQIKPLTS
jgi:hypothetical protein